MNSPASCYTELVDANRSAEGILKFICSILSTHEQVDFRVMLTFLEFYRAMVKPGSQQAILGYLGEGLKKALPDTIGRY